MTRYAVTPPGDPLPGRILSPWSRIALGDTRGLISTPTTADRAWPAANVAILVPFQIIRSGYTVRQGWAFCGTGTGGNFDVGVYDESFQLLASSGSTARAASTLVNTSGMSAIELPPGDYYAALSADGTENFNGSVPVAGLLAAAGVLEATSAFPLPASLSPAITTRALLPQFGLAFRSVAP